MNYKLKKCPFCGKHPKEGWLIDGRSGAYKIECCFINISSWTRKDACDAWNNPKRKAEG